MALEMMLSYFRNIVISINSEDKFAEKSLVEIENKFSPFDFVIQLFDLLSRPIESSTRLKISTRMKQTVEKAIKNEAFSTTEKLIILEKLADVSVEKIKSNPFILTISEIFGNLLSSLEPENEFINNLDKLFTKLVQKINQQSQQEGESGFIQVMITIANSISFNEQNIDIILNPLITFANTFLYRKNNIIKEMGFFQGSTLDLPNQKSTFLHVISKLSGIFKLIHYIVLNVLRSKNEALFQKIYDAILPFIKEGIPILFSRQNELAIFWNGKPIIDQSVNILKNRILKIINTVFSIIPKEHMNQEDVLFFKQIIQSIAFDLKLIIMKKLNAINDMPLNCDKLYENDSDTYRKELNLEYSKNIFQYLSILSKFLSIQIFMNHFQNDFIILFKDILLPLLVITKTEELMITLPKDLINYEIHFFDIITKHKNPSIKTGAAMLLLTLFKSSSTLKNYILKYSRILFENSLALLFHNRIPASITIDIENNDYQIFNLFKNNFEKILDLTLMVFLIISHDQKSELNSSENIQQILKSITQRLGWLLKCDAIHIKYKLLILINRFEKTIIAQDTESQNYFSNYLMNQLLEEKNLLLNKESSCILMKQFTSLEISKETLIEKLELITKKIENAKEPDFFELFYEIKLTIGPSDIDLFILKKICQKTNSEIKTYFRAKSNQSSTSKHLLSKTKHIIIKCFNIIREMFTCKYSSFLQNNINEISKTITPIFQYIFQSKIFDDEYMFILSQIIKYMQQIPLIDIDIISYMIYCLQKFKCLNSYLFHLVNNFFIFFSPTNESEQQSFIQLINTMSDVANNQANCILSPFYKATLIQSLFLNKCNIPDTIIKQFLEEALTNLIYLSDLAKLTLFQEYYFACNLVLVFMSFKQNDKIIMEYFSKKENNIQIKKWCSQLLTFNNYSNFHIKSIILSLTILFRIIGLDDEIFFFIEFGYKLLIKQFFSEKEQRIKIIPKEQHDRHFKGDLDSEDEDEEEFKIEDDDCNEYEKSEEEKLKKEVYEFQMNVYDPEIVKKDEFLIFSQSVEKLKEYNELKFNEWINSLNETEKKEFGEISKVRRKNVQTVENGVIKEMTLARKYLRIKNKVYNEGL